MKYNKHQLGLLTSWGLAPDATAEKTAEFYAALSQTQRDLVDALATSEPAPTPSPAPTPAPVAPQGAAPVAPAVEPVDVDAAVAQARTEENERQRNITSLCDQFEARGYRLNGLRSQMLGDMKCSLPDATKRILGQTAKNDQAMNNCDAGTGGISVGSSGRERFVAVADQVLLAHAGVNSNMVYEPSPNGHGFALREDKEAAQSARSEAERNGLMGLGLQGLARECLMNAGVRGAHRMAAQDLWSALQSMGPSAAVGGFNMSTSDFPLILEAAAHKILVAAYQGQALSFPSWCQEGPVSDFNTHKKLRLSEAPLLKKRLEGAPAVHGYLAEERETHSADEYALAIGLTRKMLINDDLSAFNDMATLLGQATGDTIENEVWDLMLSNAGAGPTMGDSIALFHASHKNLAAAGGAPNQASIETALEDFTKQAGFGEDGAKRPIAVMPQFFLGSMKQVLAANLVLKAQHAATNDTHPPQHAEIRIINPIHVAQLSTRAKLDWYLIGPKNTSPIMISYLNNVRVPRLRRVDGTTISGVQWVVEFDLGVDAVEWRTGYRNAGV